MPISVSGNLTPPAPGMDGDVESRVADPKFRAPTSFSIQTLGCRVNQYESEQWAAALRARGLVEVGHEQADLRVINTCSVTLAAAGKSRQLARRATGGGGHVAPRSVSLPLLDHPPGMQAPADCGADGRRVIITGCWATEDPQAAAALTGVDAVIGHHENVGAELDLLLTLWKGPSQAAGERAAALLAAPASAPVAPGPTPPAPAGAARLNPGTTSLPLLGQRQSGRQRAYLKVQDGCDAHCTYCIIPSLRPTLWSKPIDDAVQEARRLVEAGHLEIVLTGIFLGAYGQATALRRRQPPGRITPLARLIDALCTRVPALRRLRLSSLEPGDLTPDLLDALRSHPQIAPHLHLPLQSGSDPLLRRMNRQYSRGDYLDLIDRVRSAFDRPALTTDIIVGFPGETDEEFDRTLEVVEAARFIHIHAFSYSPRPGTAAARWRRHFVRGPVVTNRIRRLRERAAHHDLAFRRQFVGQTVEALVERDEGERSEAAQHDADEIQRSDLAAPASLHRPRHGRCERGFTIHFHHPTARPGDLVRLMIARAALDRTEGAPIE